MLRVWIERERDERDWRRARLETSRHRGAWSSKYGAARGSHEEELATYQEPISCDDDNHASSYRTKSPRQAKARRFRSKDKRRKRQGMDGRRYFMSMDLKAVIATQASTHCDGVLSFVCFPRFSLFFSLLIPFVCGSFD